MKVVDNFKRWGTVIDIQELGSSSAKIHPNNNSIGDDTWEWIKTFPFLETNDDRTTNNDKFGLLSPWDSKSNDKSSDYWTIKSNPYFNDEICVNALVKYKVINELKEGDFFGEIGLLSNLTSTATIVAT